MVVNEYGTQEIVAPASGVIAQIHYEEGDTIASEQVLATIRTN